MREIREGERWKKRGEIIEGESDKRGGRDERERRRNERRRGSER